MKRPAYIESNSYYNQHLYLIPTQSPIQLHPPYPVDTQQLKSWTNHANLTSMPNKLLGRYQ